MSTPSVKTLRERVERARWPGQDGVPGWAGFYAEDVSALLDAMTASEIRLLRPVVEAVLPLLPEDADDPLLDAYAEHERDVVLQAVAELRAALAQGRRG
jgi:hypothetical protein